MTIEEMKQKHGQEVEQEVIDKIKKFYFLSNHSKERLSNRSEYLVLFEDSNINYKETNKNINNAIDNRILAYYNTDGSINIAIDRYNYFVFVYNEKKDNFTMITFKEPSWYGQNDIYAKQKMALEGFDRKEDR